LNKGIDRFGIVLKEVSLRKRYAVAIGEYILDDVSVLKDGRSG